MSMAKIAMEDVVFEIALHADYNTTISLLKLYPHIFRCNIWKLKCQKQFPDITYFDNWTGAENYLKCIKNRFLLVFSSYDSGLLSSSYLYEYDKMLFHIYDERTCDCDFKTIIFCDIDVRKRYVVIKISHEDEPSYIWSFNKFNVEKKINSCHDGYKKGLSENNTVLAIIDLNKMVPWFLGKEKRKATDEVSFDHIEYYRYIYETNLLVKLR